MSEGEVQWVQCAQCARHVRDSDKGCPFCARDAGSSSFVRPAAVVIAALAALAPAESSAESRGPSPRLAQSRLTSAYGAPAPMYGLSPTPDPPPPSSGRYVVSVGAVIVTPSARRASVSALVLRSRADAERCLEAERGLVPHNSMIDVRLTAGQGGAPNTVVVTPRRASAAVATSLRAVQGCLQQSLARLRINPNDAQGLSLRWSYLVRHAPRR